MSWSTCACRERHDSRWAAAIAAAIGEDHPTDPNIYIVEPQALIAFQVDKETGISTRNAMNARGLTKYILGNSGLGFVRPAVANWRDHDPSKQAALSAGRGRAGNLLYIGRGVTAGQTAGLAL